MKNKSNSLFKDIVKAAWFPVLCAVLTLLLGMLYFAARDRNAVAEDDFDPYAYDYVPDPPVVDISPTDYRPEPPEIDVTPTDVSVTDAAPTQPTEPVEYEAPEPPAEVSTEMKTYIVDTSKKYGATAVQGAIIKDGHPAYFFNYGEADKSENVAADNDTKFRVASLSKPTVAMAVMKLVDDGKLNLDADISNYLGYSVRNPNHPDVPITSRMLLCYTSSIYDSSAFDDARDRGSSIPLKDLLNRKDSFTKAKPGEKYNYSNLGIAILADIAECITQKRFADYSKEVLFDPLNINCSFFASELTDQSKLANIYRYGGEVGLSKKQQLEFRANDTLGQTYHIYQGNLTASALDYATLLSVLLSNGNSGGRRILSEDSVNEMLKTQFNNGKVKQCLCLERIGGIINEKEMYCHTGSAYGEYSGFAFDPDTRSGAIVITTGANAKMLDNGMYDVCLDMLKAAYREYLEE